VRRPKISLSSPAKAGDPVIAAGHRSHRLIVTIRTEEYWMPRLRGAGQQEE
jgi:hypothetical protein